MFKKLAVVLAGAIAFAFAGCAQVPQAASDVQAQVAKACAIVQPTLLSVQAMTAADPAQQVILGKLVADNAAVCAANASLDASTVTALINTSIPAAIQVVGLLPIDDAAKVSVQIGLIAFQTALSAALAQYGAPVVPASGVTVS